MLGSPKTRRSLRRWAKWLFLVAGVAVLALLVRDAGPERVFTTLLAAGPYMALIVLLDLGWFVGELMAHRVMLEEHAQKIPWPDFIRVGFVSYAFLILVPVGRAGSEVARATLLAKYIGGGRATAVATNLQATSLLGNALISLVCAFAVALHTGVTSLLFLLVVGNAVVTGLVGGAVLLVARRSRVGRWLAAHFKMLATLGGELDEALRVRRGTLRRATAIALGARLVQTLQYGVMLLAVGGLLTLDSALIAQAIHLVGAGLGDFVPNQVGIVEGAYRLFAPALGFGADPARALSIGLLARVSQLILVSMTLAVLFFWRVFSRQMPPTSAPLTWPRKP